MPGNTIDEIMDTTPENLTLGDLQVLVAFHRNARAQLDVGIKPKKEKGPAPKLDGVMAALTKPKPEAGTIKRRI